MIRYVVKESNIKTIILIRHAKVDILNDKPFDSSQLKEWVNHYDCADIDTTNQPPQGLIDTVKNIDMVLCSKLRRTKLSAEVLGLTVLEENAIFNEADVPTVKIPWIKLRPKNWLVVLRILLILAICLILK